MKRAAELIIAAGIGVLITMAILWEVGELQPAPEDDLIPTAPPGYQYCVDRSGERLGFCTK